MNNVLPRLDMNFVAGSYKLSIMHIQHITAFILSTGVATYDFFLPIAFCISYTYF